MIVNTFIVLQYYLDKEISTKKYMIKRILCNKMLNRASISVSITNFLPVDVREELNICATDDQKCEENPLLMKLKEIILETHREESNMRGIVFVRTRVVADIIASWMKETDELKEIKARKYTGAQARGTDGGMIFESCYELKTSILKLY